MTGNGAHYISDRNHVFFTATGILTTKVRCVAIAAWNPWIRFGDLDELVEMLVTKLWGLHGFCAKETRRHGKAMLNRHVGHKLCNYVNVSENNRSCCLACSFKLVDMVKPSYGKHGTKPNLIPHQRRDRIKNPSLRELWRYKVSWLEETSVTCIRRQLHPSKQLRTKQHAVCMSM